MQSWKGVVAVRRFAVQIGGIFVAVAGVVCLGVLAFACGGSGGPRVSPTAAATARATATPDPRVAAVDAAVRRYVQALVDSMRTGSPAELDHLSVPGSQAEGNAGVAAHVVHDTGKCFVTTTLTITSLAIDLAASGTAIADVGYTLTGYDASFPSLQQLGSERSVHSQKHLELELTTTRWLVSTEH
jgi:hypothetical protein